MLFAVGDVSTQSLPEVTCLQSQKVTAPEASPTTKKPLCDPSGLLVMRSSGEALQEQPLLKDRAGDDDV